MFDIEDYIKETKQIIIKTLRDSKIIRDSKCDNNLFTISIEDEKTFYSILYLFYSLYLLEKLYSRRHSVFTEGMGCKDKVKRELKRHLLSTVPKDRQAYLLNVGGKVVLVTYFGEYHDKHVNLFNRKNILVGDFKKAIFKSLARPAYIDSAEICPIILSFKYNLSEALHIIKNKLSCKPSVKLCCNTECKSGESCSCLENIEKTIIDYPEKQGLQFKSFWRVSNIF